MLKKYSGFTLIELLVVIGILGILLAIVLIAINPAAQFAQANNTARTNDVNTILNAVHQYAADHKGLLPAGITANVQEIKKTNGADICGVLSPNYVSLFPVDPDVVGYPGATNGAAVADCTLEYQTGYTIVKDASGRITVTATAESVRGATPVISVTR
jgi:prepilin-type N-terminal cleavage/methylation domain-containing protein